MKYSKTQLDRCARALGIKGPIRIRINRGPLRDGTIMGPGGAAGAYDPEVFYDTGEHLIDLAPGRSRRDANISVAHELVHARQHEMCHNAGLDGGQLYNLIDRTAGYNDNPFETQAYEWERTIADEFAIVLTDT